MAESAEMVDALRRGDEAQVLLGITGSGKTFSIANVIATVDRPTLIIAHNKILAARRPRLPTVPASAKRSKPTSSPSSRFGSPRKDEVIAEISAEYVQLKKVPPDFACSDSFCAGRSSSLAAAALSPAPGACSAWSSRHGPLRIGGTAWIRTGGDDRDGAASAARQLAAVTVTGEAVTPPCPAARGSLPTAARRLPAS